VQARCGILVLFAAAANGQIQFQEVGDGYGSSRERWVRFGIGAQVEASRIQVRWPSGGKQELTAVRADRVVEIEEPGGPAK
jgi:hypothetical protein